MVQHSEPGREKACNSMTVARHQDRCGVEIMMMQTTREASVVLKNQGASQVGPGAIMFRWRAAE